MPKHIAEYKTIFLPGTIWQTSTQSLHSFNQHKNWKFITIQLSPLLKTCLDSVLFSKGAQNFSIGRFDMHFGSFILLAYKKLLYCFTTF